MTDRNPVVVQYNLCYPASMGDSVLHIAGFSGWLSVTHEYFIFSKNQSKMLYTNTCKGHINERKRNKTTK